MTLEVIGKDMPILFFICQHDVMDVVYGDDLLLISMFQLWIRYLHCVVVGMQNVFYYGFINLVVIRCIGNKYTEISQYLINWLKDEGNEAYLAPYLNG
uniref:Uncharacterized protein n=1 Tax=Cajanus cajan TaxID=3821 RepID=A0A151T4M7_CAJCA|nr:hypothetical protein KK1_016495 [Cajanus cajan]